MNQNILNQPRNNWKGSAFQGPSQSQDIHMHRMKETEMFCMVESRRSSTSISKLVRYYKTQILTAVPKIFQSIPGWNYGMNCIV